MTGDGPRTMKVFRVLRTGDTRVETEQDVLGWGVQLPCGLCYVDSNRDAYHEGDRLDHPHVSMYGSMADVECGWSGEIDLLYAIDCPTGVDKNGDNRQ